MTDWLSKQIEKIRSKPLRSLVTILLILSIMALGLLQGLELFFNVRRNVTSTNILAVACPNPVLPQYNLSTSPPLSSISYTLPLADSPMIIKSMQDFYTLRLDRIKQTLADADKQIKAKGGITYGSELLPLFADTTGINKKMLNTLLSRNYINFSESFDTTACTYKNYLVLDYNKGKSVHDLLRITADMACISNVIDTYIITPVQQQGEIQISFTDIFILLSNKCSHTAEVMLIEAECGDVNCSKLYFEQGRYSLAIASTLILDQLCERLAQITQKRFSISFTGYTDADPVAAPIEYKGGAYVASNLTFLPNNAVSTRKLESIIDNDELAFARAYSCYEYCRNKNKANLDIYYTGNGINQQTNDAAHKRAVFINIKQYQ